MQSLRKVFATITLASMILVGQPFAFATSVAADDDNDGVSRLEDTLHLENVTLAWAFPLANPDVGGTCSAIPSALGFINPVDNKSDRVREVLQKVRTDGSQVIVQDDQKTGTAEDSNGNTYQFVYKNREVLNVSPGQPATVDIKMTDSFRLRGNGFQMNVTFVWSWTYTAPAGVSITLEPFADFTAVPFVFATADGINPAPGVTNWEQLSTRGDPFNCDPL